MGEMADDLIDQMIDDGYFPSPAFMPRGRNRPYNTKIKPKVKEYPAKTFDMGFFPTSIPKPRIIVNEEPKEQLPDPWDTSDEEAPF